MTYSFNFKKVMLTTIKAFFFSLFVSNSASATNVEPLKILFIGNSFTHMNDMPSMLQHMANKGGQNAIIEKNTQSGASFQVHSKREDMYEAINSRKWDYVILQGYSRELSHSKAHIDTATVPYIQQITDSIFANNQCTNVLFYMTWGYENGFLDREEINTYEKMADSIEVGYRYIGEKFNFPIVPVGMVWKHVKGISSIDLYALDRAHPSKDGSYLIATTFYNAIFDESNEHVFTNTISANYAETIKREAKNYVSTHRQKYHLERNKITVKSWVSKEGEYMLYFSSTYADSLNIKWIFGDGKQSEDRIGTHEFRKSGSYVVLVVIEDDCGVRTFEKLVQFAKPAKPTKSKRTKPKYNVKNTKKV